MKVTFKNGKIVLSQLLWISAWQFESTLDRFCVCEAPNISVVELHQSEEALPPPIWIRRHETGKKMSFLANFLSEILFKLQTNFCKELFITCFEKLLLNILVLFDKVCHSVFPHFHVLNSCFNAWDWKTRWRRFGFSEMLTVDSFDWDTHLMSNVIDWKPAIPMKMVRIVANIINNFRILKRKNYTVYCFRWLYSYLW